MCWNVAALISVPPFFSSFPNPSHTVIAQIRRIFRPYFRQLYSKYIFIVLFIHKSNHTVVCTSFGRSKIAQWKHKTTSFKLYFRVTIIILCTFYDSSTQHITQDIWANEPLPKFGFWNVFVTSKNWNVLFWLDLQNLLYFNCFTHLFNRLRCKGHHISALCL